MAEEVVRMLTGISGGASTDGKGIVLVCGAEDDETTFGIALQDVPAVIGTMLSYAIQASEKLTAEKRAALPASPATGPSVTSMALGPSESLTPEALIGPAVHAAE